jgi:hypothetical protein
VSSPREGQLDLFTEPTRARPTRISAAGVVPKVAKRLGYDFCGCCEHCGGFVTLTGDWGPDGWIHRNTGSTWCDPRDVAIRERFAHLYKGVRR